MMNIAILLIIYVFGFYLSYVIIKIDHIADGEVYTKLQRLVNILFSIGSFLTIIIFLLASWFSKIAKTGYWDMAITEKKIKKVDNQNNSQ